METAIDNYLPKHMPFLGGTMWTGIRVLSEAEYWRVPKNHEHDEILLMDKFLLTAWDGQSTGMWIDGISTIETSVDSRRSFWIDSAWTWWNDLSSFLLGAMLLLFTSGWTPAFNIECRLWSNRGFSHFLLASDVLWQWINFLASEAYYKTSQEARTIQVLL